MNADFSLIIGENLDPLPTQLLTSKPYIPPLRPNLVPRPRLIQLMSDGLQSKRNLTLVSAPEGFGKTTLVVAWLKEIGHPAAWLSLDKADGENKSRMGIGT